MTRKKLNNVLALLLAAVLAVGLLPIQASAASIRFSDVPDGQWYTEYVTRLAGEGIVGGVGNGKFEPGRNVSSAEMIKMVTNAVFKPEFTAYEQANRQAMDAYFGSTPPWYGHMAYFAKNRGLLDGVSMDIDSPTSCNAPMTRYDMALVLHNAATKKGIAVSADAKAVAKAELTAIGHYYDIPEKYRDAVVACYAAGIINGKGEQGFCGNDNMTRAEACAVIIRLEDLLKNGGGSIVDPDPTPSTPDEPVVKDIAVTTSTNSQGTAYTVADNGFGTGKLNNGKPINEANILELLDKAKEIWPAGMAWAEQGEVSNNNWYANTSTMMRNIGCGNFACGGFAAMLSDYVYGRSANPIRKVNNFADIRVGDIIVQTNHIMIVTGINQTSNRNGYLFCAQGNYGDIISWPGTRAWDAFGPDDLGSYVAYTRWPESAATQPATPTTTPDLTPSTPDEPVVKDIAVTTSTNSQGTAYTVADNGFGTGKLNNGKEITEANILELFDKAKAIWPADMTWAERNAVSNNNWYANPSSTMRNINCNNFACGGFAALLSDYIYGHSGNPVRRVNGFENIRVGDTIMQLDSNGSPRHAMTVVGINRTNLDTGYLFLAEGNISTIIRWPDTTNRWDSLGPDDLAVYGSYVAYTRWPA